MKVTKDTIIGDLVDAAPVVAPILQSIGMHCLGCPTARGETLEEACQVHGADVNALLRALNEALDR